MLWDPIEAINRAILARDTSKKRRTSDLGMNKKQQQTETPEIAQLMRMEVQMQEMMSLLQRRHENAVNAGLHGLSNDIQATGIAGSSGLKETV